MGIAFVRTGTQGIWIQRLDSSGNPSGAATSIEATATWRLFQQQIDNLEDPPLYAASSAAPTKLYRITTIATEIYANASMDFYSAVYPISVGRYHLMAIYPGLCQETLAAANHDKARAVYLNLETRSVDFCVQEIPQAKSVPDTDACGNGILDPISGVASEACDDGNKVNGDGCSSTCTVELGWRCSNSPFKTRSLCERNECGDGFINKVAPENEVCDDGNLLGTDGCSSDCRTIAKNYFCPRPNQLCVKVCPNAAIISFPPTPYRTESYIKACDDGNEDPNDGTLRSHGRRLL